MIVARLLGQRASSSSKPCGRRRIPVRGGGLARRHQTMDGKHRAAVRGLGLPCAGPSCILPGHGLYSCSLLSLPRGPDAGSVSGMDAVMQTCSPGRSGLGRRHGGWGEILQGGRRAWGDMSRRRRDRPVLATPDRVWPSRPRASHHHGSRPRRKRRGDESGGSGAGERGGGDGSTGGDGGGGHRTCSPAGAAPALPSAMSVSFFFI